MKKIISGLLASVLAMTSCGDFSSDSNLKKVYESGYDSESEIILQRVKFQAILGIGETVSTEDLLAFTNAPRTEYDDVPKGDMRDLLRSMKRGVKGKDVSHYFYDFFHQEETIERKKEDILSYLNSRDGFEFIEKFDDFIKSDDDDQTHDIIYDSIERNLICGEQGCSLKLIDIVVGIRGTEKITAYVMKIKGDQDFYDNMIKNLKQEAEAYRDYSKPIEQK